MQVPTQKHMFRRWAFFDPGQLPLQHPVRRYENQYTHNLVILAFSKASFHSHSFATRQGDKRIEGTSVYAGYKLSRLLLHYETS